MKRFLRYLLLAMCVVSPALWGWSISHYARVVYTNPNDEVRGIGIVGGNLTMFDIFELENPIAGLSCFASRLPNGDHYRSAYELGMPKYNQFFVAGKPWHELSIPLWLFSVGFYVIAIAMWYHPLKTRWRGTHSKGFEVEMKDKSSADGK